MNRYQPPIIITYEAAPDVAQPRATLVVSELLDAATHQLDYAYPLLPVPRAGQAARDQNAALDELRAIVEGLCARVAVLEGRA